MYRRETAFATSSTVPVRTYASAARRVNEARGLGCRGILCESQHGRSPPGRAFYVSIGSETETEYKGRWQLCVPGCVLEMHAETKKQGRLEVKHQELKGRRSFCRGCCWSAWAGRGSCEEIMMIRLIMACEEYDQLSLGN
ncbi:hypothetical protein GOBAR_DD12689 [Gossypium barbadense]|nr:hypothetical protein GOBAR_DD12689 [Gossypium barbadense]